MATCLRCGAESEWIKGRVPDEPREMESLLREAEGLLCDPRGGYVSTELAERIRSYFASAKPANE